ncbi:ribbon-helix-helix protein, CopG family [Scytonema sp. PCC 10023]|uniref:ribbon-helix-helix protein, CopG family n=1 Tax=Scytonema sp. PCC 10023 TaxID=1680591 RepID=UPI0039C6E30C
MYGIIERYNLRLSDKEYKDIKNMSALTERSINDLIREAIREYVEKKERETKG